MAQANFDPSNDRYIRALIRRKTDQLTGRAGFNPQDRHDLEADMLVRVLQGLKAFDPNKSHIYAFVTTVLERYTANLLRNTRAAKRNHRGVTSLNVLIEITDNGQTELAQTIGERELNMRRGRRARSDEELMQLALDLADVIATLPESWQTLLELRKTQSMPEIAREMGIPRTTLNEWQRKIRQRFEKAGLKHYL